MSLRPRLLLGTFLFCGLLALGAYACGLSTGRALALALAAGALLGLGFELLVITPLSRSARTLRRRIHDTDSRSRTRDRNPLLGDLELLDHAIGLANDDFSKLARATRMANEVIEASSVGVALLDDQGVITEVNPALRQMFRFRAPPFGRRLIEVVSSIDLHLVCTEANEAGHAERTFVTETSDLIAKANRLSSGVLLRVEDVTSQREAERARNVFVANVSHELRTPLTAILGYLETLQFDEERIPEDLRPLLHTVDRNAKRLRNLFDDLLRLHRIESRRRELPMSREALRPILQSAVGAACDQARMRGQACALRCPDDLTAWVNPDGLSAIVSNLTSNASAYTHDDGSIEVIAEPVPGGVDIQVIDNGIGIDPADHERVFQRFYRVNEARDRRVGGTGLGLAIVKHYALACGFDLKLDSTLGKGTRFTVHLPEPTIVE